MTEERTAGAGRRNNLDRRAVRPDHAPVTRATAIPARGQAHRHSHAPADAPRFHDISAEHAFTCPRCRSHQIVRGGAAPSTLAWIVLTLITGGLALVLFLLTHGLDQGGKCRCLACGLVSKRKYFDPLAAHRYRRIARRNPMPNRPKNVFARRA